MKFYANKKRMAPKVKPGKFAKRTHQNRTLAKLDVSDLNTPAVSRAVGKAIMGAKKKKVPVTRIALIMPRVEVRQPPPHKAATTKK